MVSRDSEKEMEWVSVIDARLAIQKLWLAYCGADTSIKNDVGYCNGKQSEMEDARSNHMGFGYNAIGGLLSLGTKADRERVVQSYSGQIAATYMLYRGRNTFSSEDAMTVGLKKFEESGTKVGRCLWNVKHDDPQENQDELRLPFVDVDEQADELEATTIPMRFSKTNDCDGFRSRNLADFPTAQSKTQDTPVTYDTHDTHDAEVFHRRMSNTASIRRRLLLGNGHSRGGVFNSDEDMPKWWFENPYSENESLNAATTYGEIRKSDANKRMDEKITVGAAPYGWNR